MPVDSFVANDFGLFNMIGNVWEWTVDPFQSAHNFAINYCSPRRDVQVGQNIVTKGGAFLCAPSYCWRYRASARSPQEAYSSTSNLGFRCVDQC